MVHESLKSFFYNSTTGHDFVPRNKIVAFDLYGLSPVCPGLYFRSQMDIVFLFNKVQSNLDLRKILVTPKIFLKSRCFLISNTRNNHKKLQIEN